MRAGGARWAFARGRSRSHVSGRRSWPHGRGRSRRRRCEERLARLTRPIRERRAIVPPWIDVYAYVVRVTGLKVGLCGFTVAQSRYLAEFSVVEIQQTFYQPPATQVIDRWRAVFPENFEFTLKAWQLITHPVSSPTYHRMTRALTWAERAGAGGFRASEIVDEGWAVTLDCAARLRATAILFQCPESFGPTPENLDNLRAFVARIDRPVGVRLLFEPRGPDWTYERARPLCDELDLVYVVDPFVTRWPTGLADRFTYFRLHGVSGARHSYSDAELAELAELARSPGEVYVMFNNIPRHPDAQRFLQQIANRGAHAAPAAPARRTSSVRS